MFFLSREGCIKVGDRVVAINGYKVAHLTLTETLSLFSQCDTSAVFTMSYDVAVQGKSNIYSSFFPSPFFSTSSFFISFL